MLSRPYLCELSPLYFQFILVCMLVYWCVIAMTNVHLLLPFLPTAQSFETTTFSLLSIPLTLNRFVEPDPSHTLEERVVHWYFAQLDNNGSHDINKKELKPFKRYLKKKAKPKKCARKFTDYCDLNKDRAISLQELKGCLGVSKEGKRKRKTEWEETRWLTVGWHGMNQTSWAERGREQPQHMHRTD